MIRKNGFKYSYPFPTFSRGDGVPLFPPGWERGRGEITKEAMHLKFISSNLSFLLTIAERSKNYNPKSQYYERRQIMNNSKQKPPDEGLSIYRQSREVLESIEEVYNANPRLNLPIY
jgi:hypothetical protein